MNCMDSFSTIRLVTVNKDNGDNEHFCCKFSGTEMCQYIKGQNCLTCIIMQGILSKAALVEETEQEILQERHDVK